MPNITATFEPTVGLVLITLNWSDIPTVTFARVLRVLPDGSETPVRPHTSVDASGDAIELSGGLAVLWDTEAPLDVPIFYRTEAVGSTAVMLGLQVSDTFTRVTANGWGTADTGQTYLLVGPAANYATTGTVGTISLNVINTLRVTNPVPLKARDVAFSVDISVPVVATGAPIVTEVWVRATSAANAIKFTVQWTTAATVITQIAPTIANVFVAPAPAFTAPQTHVAGATWRLKGYAVDDDLRVKMWPIVEPEPDWQATAINAAVPSTADVDIAAYLSTGNTNVQPVVISFDNLQVNTDQAAGSTEALASGGDLWLKAPLRPWANQRVVLDIPQEPDCVPEEAIFFQSMDTETRSARTQTFVVNNRKNPVTATRVRGGISSTLFLVTRKFTDRDDVITLNAPGDPLFFQGPATYGIPDRYMTVGDYDINRLTSDHRQEWRVHALPHVEIDRPAGLADGIVGNRWVDLCQRYGTFAEATAAGLTWTGVLLGQGALPPVTAFRVYADIPVDFATYGAIPSGGRTYEDLLEDR